jgi:hypothetical protein
MSAVQGICEADGAYVIPNASNLMKCRIGFNVRSVIKPIQTRRAFLVVLSIC